MRGQFISLDMYGSKRMSAPYGKQFRGREIVGGSFPRPEGFLRGFLRQYVLQRIGERPVHGYEILRVIETKTKGAWRPSAGSIYPILRGLLAEGYIRTGPTKRVGRHPKVYSITRAGAKYLEQQSDMFLKVGKNYGAMRPIIIELIPPQQVPKLFTPMVAGQFDLVRGIVESKMDKIPPREVKLMLKEYVLALEKQLKWARHLFRPS